MTLTDLQKVIDAELICGDDLGDTQVEACFANDFMSDVLAFATNENVLITGMINPQVIRTAQMLDMKCIVFIRGKKPTNDIVDLANKNGMMILSTPYIMYKTCGLLYEAGIKG